MTRPQSVHVVRYLTDDQVSNVADLVEVDTAARYKPAIPRAEAVRLALRCFTELDARR